MSVTFGSIVFDEVLHDAEADVLYLNVRGQDAVHWKESPEGHVLRFNSQGELIGLTIIGVRGSMDAQGRVGVTTPKREELGLQDLGLAVA